MGERNGLDVLGCEIELRPRGAPGIEEIAAAIVGVERSKASSLALEFNAAAAADVEAFVAAEQRCCSTLSWSVGHTDGVTRLTVGAEPAQIDLLERLFSQHA